jgi:hypothetical protein
MSRFQLVFRSDGERDRIEHRFNDSDAEPQIDGRLLVDGETYDIRGVEWLVRREDVGGTPRFVCTLVAEPSAP